MQDNLPKRKLLRLRRYDYSSDGVYFITICTDKKLHTLSRIIYDNHNPEKPFVKLTASGELIDKLIKHLPTRYPFASVCTYVIMPNHIHLLLKISRTIPPIDRRGGVSPPATTSVPAIIAWLKYHSTKAIRERSLTMQTKVFQRSYYDHIVRNRDDYEEIHRYICENPLRWHIDCFYSE